MTDRLLIQTTVLPTGDAAELWIESGRLVAGPLDGATAYPGGFAVPGLVDAHAHLALASPAAGSGPDRAVRASALAHLESGVLAVREPGSPNRASAAIDPSEMLPTVITAGRFLAPPGRYFPGLAREVADDELLAAAEEELDESGGWVKVIGDFFDDSGRFSVNYETETLSATAEAVRAAGGRIAMHAMMPESIQQAIDAGFDAIEHGSIPAEGQVDAMAKAGMTWVPTVLIDDVLRDSAPSMLGPGADWLQQGLERHGEHISRAHELGVRILAGTDAGMTPHGMVAQEIRLLHAMGLPAEAALAAGSWEARSYLGLPGIEIGAPADLVVFPDDPREDLSVLRHPQLIILRGSVMSGRS